MASARSRANTGITSLTISIHSAFIQSTRWVNTDYRHACHRPQHKQLSYRNICSRFLLSNSKNLRTFRSTQERFQDFGVTQHAHAMCTRVCVHMCVRVFQNLRL